jgi:hypothetical protein
MNTSRDIEKLFDHFGGNATDYQEIGRENEAKTARTRWPLLATLDFAQPAIPEIATRRDGHANTSRAHEQTGVARDDETSSQVGLTPINRGKTPLFARPHRRAIPPVDSTNGVDAHRASRFGSPADADAPVESAAPTPPVAPIPPVSRAPVTRAPAIAPAIPAARDAAAPSILGKLFEQKAEAPAAPTPAASDSLTSIFTRLRESAPDDTNRSARAFRSRS